MAMTPQDYLDISEEIEGIYQRTVDELLINIATHFNINGWERTRFWEIKKLAEMGALTEESAQIIAKNTGKTEEEIRKAFLEVAEKACYDIDPELREAAKQGILQDPGNTPSTSILMRQMVQAYVDQAVDKLNMTNQTMLESTRQAYVRGVTQVANAMQLEESKRILEAQSLEVTTGQETFTRAVRKAMNQIAATGLTGFVDSKGRIWQPEGYAAMVIRTTSHNAAVQSIKTRQAEYGGGDVFQISAHTGARPLCAPYQGNVYSWSHNSGVIHDGNGKEIHYDPISSTSYGMAAGIFGINCGHHPIPLVDGYSFLQDKPDQTPEENDKEYKESQKQRALERRVRRAKRELEMAIATGDKEGEAAAKKQVRAAQKAVKAYVEKTGRVRRYDRERVSPAVLGGGTPPATPAPAPAPTPASEPPKPVKKTYAEVVKEIRDEAGGVYSEDQIIKAGHALSEAWDEEVDNWGIEQRDELQRLGEMVRYYSDQYRGFSEEIKKLEKAQRRVKKSSPEYAELQEQIYVQMRFQRTANDEIWKLQNQEIRLQRELDGLIPKQREWLISKLSEVREMGADGIDIMEHLGNSKSPVAPYVEMAYKCYPKDWVAKSVAWGPLKPSKAPRGQYTPVRVLYGPVRPSLIEISGGEPDEMFKTAIHELGHRFEDSDNHLQMMEMLFYNRRTKGCKAEWLGLGYGKEEVTRKDNFINPYIGKDYGGDGYELLSMGFEYAYTTPRILKADPEYRDWIYGILSLK